MNASLHRGAACWLAFGLVLGIDAVRAAPEKIPTDKVVHPIMGSVSNPEILPETRKDPVYPEKWRKLHLGGRVILQGVVEKSGSIGQVDSLQTNLRVETECGKDPGSPAGEKPGGEAGKESGNQVAPPEAFRDFETAAVSAVKQWKYKPGMQSNAVPVDVYYTFIVSFTSCPKEPQAGSPPSPR